MSRRVWGPLVTFLLVIGVGAAIYKSALPQLSEPVRGLSGSEKLPFFHDPRTIEALSKAPYRLTVDVEKAGSRQIATSYNLTEYDFAFPAGVPAAEKIRQQTNKKKSYQVFFTPMVIASWKIIADILEANGVVSKKNGIYYIINMEKLFNLIIEKKRWNELEQSEKYPVNKSILVTTTDIRKSNSAAMFLSLASYILNGNTIVQNSQQAMPLMDDLSAIFLRQGMTGNTSSVPFQDYLTMGPGKSPMVMMYEAQFLHELSKENSAISDDMVLLYPEPTLYTKHVLIPMNEKGETLGEALTQDEDILKIATEHGLRTQNTQLFLNYFKSKGIQVPEFLVNVIEPPSYEVLESTIMEIERRYQ